MQSKALKEQIASLQQRVSDDIINSMSAEETKSFLEL